MGYNAYSLMRKKNNDRWKIDGPMYPEEFDVIRVWKKGANGRRKNKPDFLPITDLEKKSIHFIREMCTDLRFNKDDEKHINLEDMDGSSLKKNQIPYNFQMDCDRRCLEVAIHRFLESGVAKDAFDVYFCFLEMFVGEYGKTKKMIEMLSEFETNASSLLMKHRDHYSHSVYVFLIGLAFYDESDCFRKAYKDAYAKLMSNPNPTEHDLAAHFLKYWGLTSLFHDIGYPFELSFEQVKSYFGDTIDFVPFVAFNMNNFYNPKIDEIIDKSHKLKEKCIILRDEIAESGSSSNSFTNQTESLLKKLDSYVSQINGTGFMAYKDFKQEKPVAASNLTAYLNKTIHYIDEFIPQIQKTRDDTVNKLSKVAGIDEEDRKEGIENLNVFLAEILYRELGDDYAYYNHDTKRRFKNYDSFIHKQEDRLFYNYRDYLYDVLCLKPEHPEAFGGFIDHAYFSTVILLANILQVYDAEELNPMFSHALTAILLHNSLYKFSITNYDDNGENGFNNGKHFPLQKNPLAYLLMLCDELQCWDRTSYGQNSRGEVHPFDCELTFENNKITATYLFDKDRYADGDELKQEYDGVKGTYKKLCTDKKGIPFLTDIEHIISINGDDSFGCKNAIELKVDKRFEKNERFKNASLSTSNFIHLYKFSILVHQMNHLDENKTKDEMEKEFEQLSLEYKINHISRTKKFSKILDKIGCFYSDKPMDCEIVYEFGDELNEVMGPIEHERWIWEHWVMGWRYTDKDTLAKADQLSGYENGSARECLKLHSDMVELENGKYSKEEGIAHFRGLTDKTKEKDTRSMKNLLKVLAKEDGVKVYRLREEIH